MARRTAAIERPDRTCFGQRSKRQSAVDYRRRERRGQAWNRQRLLGEGDTFAVDAHEAQSMTNPGSDDVEYVVFGIAGNKGGETVVP